MKERFEIALVASIVCLLAGITILGTYDSPWRWIGATLIAISWALALKTGVTIGEILKEKEDKGDT
jgi:uncharacterized membrane protein YdbT with pleckstrin-like domain